MTRTYSRQTTASNSASVFGKKAPGRKPLSTFNSAPALSSVRSTARTQDDSLDDFVVGKKTTKKKKKTRVKKHVTLSIFEDEPSSNSKPKEDDTFSPPTPIFRRAVAQAASDKDDKFDKLFAAGPIRGTSARKSSNPSPCWGSSSKESSIEKENSSKAPGLFASFEEEKPLDLPRRKDSKKKGQRAAAGIGSSRQRQLTVPKITDRRPFSDETLNYVSKGLEAVSLVDDDVFESPAKEANLASGIDYESPKFCPPAVIGGQQATSTPNVVKSRLSEDDQEQSVVMAPPLLLPPACDLIHRKGGKRWRRRTSSVANGLTTPSRRRTTMMIDRRLPAELNLSRRKTTVCFHQNTTTTTSDAKLMKDVVAEETKALVEASFDEDGLHSSFHISGSSSPLQAVADSLLLKSQNTRKFDEPSDIDKVLSRCTPSQILPLENLYTPQRLSSARKVGEGAFGEVFILPNDSSHSSEEDDENGAVVKIVPVDGEALVNGQPQMKLIDMLAEIIISTELSKLSSAQQEASGFDIAAPGFLTVLSCNLTEGRYPDHLLDKWDDFDRQKGSENERPDEELFKDSTNQLFVVLQLRNGGQDLENAELLNAAQGFAIFQQVAHALAIAEKALQFEHRDLHWGNILVAECRQKTLQYRFGADQFTVETHGLRATIIDFSLSRLTLPNDEKECDIFNNLSEDPDLFTSEGDYQFDVYRMMKEHTSNDWNGFHPRTNVMWLHYLLDKLTSEVYYKNKKSKTHRSALGKMRQMKNEFLDNFNSAYEYVTCMSGDPEKENST